MICLKYFLDLLSVANADWLLLSTINMALSVYQVCISVGTFLWFVLCLAYTQAKERFEPHTIKVSDPFDVKPGGSEHTYTDTWVRTYRWRSTVDYLFFNIFFVMCSSW